MPKRVAILLPSLVGGGAERSARFVGLALERAGYRVDLAVAVRKGALADDPWVRAHLVDLRAPNELLSLRGYLRYLDAARPDLVISFVHSANLISGLGGWRRPDIPFIVSVRNTLVKERRDQWWVRRRFGFGLERRLYARAARVQTISDEVAAQCRALFATPSDRLVVTYNSALDPGTPLPVIADPSPDIAALQPYLVSVGRLAPIKGFETLLAAFAAAGLTEPWRLVLVGDGPMRGELEQTAQRLGIADRVVFAGYRDPVWPWIAHARGFLFASRGEAFGRVLHEALLADLPIAAASGPGINEVLDHGAAGRLLAAGDVPAFAAAMRDIASGTLHSAPSDSRARQLAKFDPDAVAARYVAMVHDVIGAA